MKDKEQELTNKQKYIKSCMEFLKQERGYPVVDYLSKLTEQECFWMMTNIAMSNDLNEKQGKAKATKEILEIIDERIKIQKKFLNGDFNHDKSIKWRMIGFKELKQKIKENNSK